MKIRITKEFGNDLETQTFDLKDDVCASFKFIGEKFDFKVKLLGDTIKILSNQSLSKMIYGKVNLLESSKENNFVIPEIMCLVYPITDVAIKFIFELKEM